ncbi:hypothetical protein E2C01_096104 [Portunus trituberculatus]|uniref:Uncharacterized protein n=1 Tax=Portunus trituberculatus TaxID=210409 RepID=A0A5B7K102_PORTR|nr:hypothetical protein [Portunus trituberculatus]
MVPSLLDTTLYNGVHRPQDMCGTMIDRITFVLGYPIIRQIRRKPGIHVFTSIITPFLFLTTFLSISKAIETMRLVLKSVSSVDNAEIL